MTDTISITVPVEHSALTRASDMLHGLAIDLKEGAAGWSPPEATSQVEMQQAAKTIAASEPRGVSPVKAALESIEKVEDYTPSVDTSGDVGQATDTEPDPTEVFGGTPATETPVGTGTPPPPTDTAAQTPPPGVPLDSAGLPWDSRIHSGGKSTIKNGTWKKKRGVEPETLAAIEAELRGVQDAPAATTQTPADAPVATFAGFMLKLTGSAVTEAQALDVLNQHGIVTIPLLATRPDLIPTVEAELFGGVS